MVAFMLRGDFTILAALYALIGFIVGVFAGRFTAPERKSRPLSPPGQREKEKRTKGQDTVELYVGNLSYDMDEAELRKTFERYGRVASVRLIENRGSGRSKGYGFVEMVDAEGAAAVIKAMNGKELKGRALVVNEARNRKR